MHAACRDVMIPAFDRCCHQVFTQIKDAFDSGIQQSMCFAPVVYTFVSRFCVLISMIASNIVWQS